MTEGGRATDTMTTTRVIRQSSNNNHIIVQDNAGHARVGLSAMPHADRLAETEAAAGQLNGFNELKQTPEIKINSMWRKCVCRFH